MTDGEWVWFLTGIGGGLLNGVLIGGLIVLAWWRTDKTKDGTA